MTHLSGPILCPFCDEPTLPNRLGDGSVVCSCAAERELDVLPLGEMRSRAGHSAPPGTGAVQRSVPQGAGYQPNPSPSAATWPTPGKGK